MVPVNGNFLTYPLQLWETVMGAGVADSLALISVGQQLSEASFLIGALCVAALLFSALGLLSDLFSLLFC